MKEPVDVVADTARAAVLLNPTRLRILEVLAEPRSAAAIAPLLDLPRQLVNYHLRALEAQNLVTMVEERRKGSVCERFYRRTADSYAIAPQALGGVGSQGTDATAPDRLSSGYQLAMAGRVIRDLAELREGAAAAGKTLPTISLEVDVRFADAAARSAFAQELADAVAALVRRYDDAGARGGRRFRFFMGAYPKPKGRP